MYSDLIGPAIEAALKMFEGILHIFETSAEKKCGTRDKEISRLMRRLAAGKDRASIAFTPEGLGQELGRNSEDVLDSLIRLQRGGEVYEDQFGWHAGAAPSATDPRFAPRF